MSATVVAIRIGLRSTHGYDFAVRLFGSMWFLLLAAFVGYGTFGQISTYSWPQLLSKLCLAVFYLILWFLVISRPPAKSEASGLLPRVAAFVGTYMPWVVTFAVPTGPAVPNLLSTICLCGGLIMTIITVSYLGKSFSLVPQARKPVQSGPYRWVKHPLYLSEEIAIFGVVLQFLSPLTVVILIGHIAVQVCRIHYEEKLLSETFPEYKVYAASRWHLFPFIW